MLLAVARFELRYQLRRPVFWVCFGLFFLLTFAAETSDAVTIGSSIGQVHRNAPFVIMQILLVMSALGVLVTTAFVADAVQRDDELQTRELFYSTRLTRRAYLLGRFSGAFAAALLIFAGVALAILLGSFMPWLEAERLGPTRLLPYLSSLVLLVAPNVFLQACLFFALATATRSLSWTYVGAVAFLVGYGASQAVLGDAERESLAALADPFGLAALATSTKYWTVADRNTLALPLGRDLLLNRLIWLAVALAALAATGLRFRFDVEWRRGRRRGRRPALAPTPPAEPAGAFAAPTPPAEVPQPPGLVLPPAQRDFGQSATWRQLVHQAWVEVRAMVLAAPFLVVVAFGVFNVVARSGSLERLGFGSEVWPVTHVMLEMIDGSYLFLIVVLLAFLAGEAAQRERSVRFAGVHDALPVPGWVFWGGKLAALAAALAVMLTVAMATAIAIQAWRGYHHFELGLYLKWIYARSGIPFLMVAVLALFLQALAGNRYLGYAGMLLYLISSVALSALHFQHNLYHFAGAPAAPYSDMNGFGHFVAPRSWFYLYWGFFTVALVALLHLSWVRGADGDLRSRLRLARQRLTRPVRRVVAVAAAGFAITGGFIFWNTNVRNRYVPDDLAWDRQADYEKAYAKYRALPQPRITEVEAAVDIWPAERAVDIRGTYRLVNKAGVPIERVHLWLNPEVSESALTLPGAAVELDDRTHGYSIHRLARPLVPGASIDLAYTVRVRNPGFVNHGANLQVVANGTFFDSAHYFPHVGYQRGGELSDPNQRRKRGLPPIQRLPRLEDQAARRDNALSSEADWVRFATTVSTSADQVAMAPGYLVREWSEGKRRYFRYEMDAPILAYWAYVSGRYAVARDTWKGPGSDVAIEVYHHPGHAWNVPRMIDAVKKSLDYFTTRFSPYQHRQVRILEFPGYRTFAQSFPNTIPYSESIGFVLRLDEELAPDDIDNVFYVTAHEVAHQWWAHQVIGGNVQGSSLLAETLSQYSALMVMEREYGPTHMRKFLKRELDRYLRGRGGERIEELPLLRVEDQPYLHYNKGSVVMYALRDAIGSDAVDRALARFIRRTAYQEPPYTTTLELMEELRAVTPGEHQALLSDLFEHITLFDNRAESATAVALGDGRYEVTIAIASGKLRADGQGVEKPVPVDDWLDVAVFGAATAGGPPEGELLALEKVRVRPDTRQVTLLVAGQPVKAGVDPFVKTIDRNPDDNLVTVEVEAR